MVLNGYDVACGKLVFVCLFVFIVDHCAVLVASCYQELVVAEEVLLQQWHRLGAHTISKL